MKMKEQSGSEGMESRREPRVGFGGAFREPSLLMPRFFNRQVLANKLNALLH